jgi:AraC-like DNA-binding protein
MTCEDRALQGAASKPAIPQNLFVGTIEGVSACTPDEDVHDIWPKFLVMVLLQGAQHFLVDGCAFRIDAGDGDACRPLVFMLNVARYARLRFVNDSVVPLRKVMISAPLPWVEWLTHAQGGGLPTLRDFFAGHLASFRFTPGRQILQLCEQVMSPPPSMRGEMHTLYRNSRALDIMCLACTALVEQDESDRRPRIMSRRQSERVRDFIVDNLDKSLTIEAIAREAGASVSRVQRHFKEHFGLTVFEFIRSRRLALAYAALERDGVTIAQAAYAAGYAAPSHFSTAFKKTYGFAPRHMRR